MICISHEKLSWASSHTVADAYGIGGKTHETVCKSDYQYDIDIEIMEKYWSYIINLIRANIFEYLLNS